MAVRGVDDEEIGAGVGERLRPALGVLAHPHGRADDEPSLRVLRGVGEPLALGEVLDRDQAAQPARRVDQRKLLHLVGAEQAQGLVAPDPDRSGHERHRRHHLGDPALLVGLEPDVAVRDNAEQDPVRARHRHAGDAVAGAQPLDVGHGGVSAAGHRIRDHASLGPLHHVDLLSLVLDRQVAVQHARAALARHGHGHPRLGDGIHGRRNQRHPQRDASAQRRRRIRLARHDRRVGRQQQHVVEGQGGRGELGAVGHLGCARLGTGHVSS